jgi:hypothetical protein
LIKLTNSVFPHTTDMVSLMSSAIETWSFIRHTQRSAIFIASSSGCMHLIHPNAFLV